MPLAKAAPRPYPAGMGGSGPNSGLHPRKRSAVFARDKRALELLILWLVGFGAGRRVLEAGAQQGAAESRGCALAAWLCHFYRLYPSPRGFSAANKAAFQCQPCSGQAGPWEMLKLGAPADFSCSASLWFCPLLGFAAKAGWQEQIAQGQ